MCGSGVCIWPPCGTSSPVIAGIDADGGGGSCGSSSKSSIGCSGCSGSIRVGSTSTFAASGTLGSGATFAFESRSFALATVETGGPGCSGGRTPSGRFSTLDGSLQPSGCDGSSAIIQSPVCGPAGIWLIEASSSGSAVWTRGFATATGAGVGARGAIVGPCSPGVIVQSPLGVASSTVAFIMLLGSFCPAVCVAPSAISENSFGGELVIITGPLGSSSAACITDVSRISSSLATRRAGAAGSTCTPDGTTAMPITVLRGSRTDRSGPLSSDATCSTGTSGSSVRSVGSSASSTSSIGSGIAATTGGAGVRMGGGGATMGVATGGVGCRGMNGGGEVPRGGVLVTVGSFGAGPRIVSLRSIFLPCAIRSTAGAGPRMVCNASFASREAAAAVATFAGVGIVGSAEVTAGAFSSAGIPITVSFAAITGGGGARTGSGAATGTAATGGGPGIGVEAGAFSSAGIPITVALPMAGRVGGAAIGTALAGVGWRGITGVCPVGVLIGGMPIVVGDDEGAPGTLGDFGRIPPATGGIDGTVNLGPAFGPSSLVSVDRSPITTHSASALTASIRPVGAGGVGRGSAGISAGRGATLGGAGFICSRAFSSSPSSVLLGSSGSVNLRVMPTRP